MSSSKVRAAAWIALAGVVAASCDIAYALVFSGWKGVPAQRLLQSVASGWLGLEAFRGGAATAALGLALHYGIVMVATILFWGVARRWSWLREEPITTGLLYGVAIYAFMNFVVLPLSAYPYPINFPLLRTSTGLLVHMIGVGLPISLITRRAG